jgi:hypothetical protein
MRIVFSQPRYGLKSLLKHTSLTFLAIVFSLAIADIATRKENVIIDENYAGKYIKVLHYKSFNRDSVYNYYYKPKNVKVEVLDVMKQNDARHTIQIQDGKYVEYVEDLTRNYKVGQKVTLRKTFYPSVEYHEIK